MGLREDLREALFVAIKGSLPEMREIMTRENERGSVHFVEMNWRLSMVSACRQRQKMLQPKYTVRVETQQ